MTYPQCMASAFLALTSLNMRTASAGEACILDMIECGEYALEHQIGVRSRKNSEAQGHLDEACRVIRTQWVATRHRSLRNVPPPRRTRGKREHCSPGLLPHRRRGGRPETRCLQQNMPSCVSGGPRRPRIPRAREIGRTTHGSRCAARACRTAALPHPRRGRRHWRMGGLLASCARPTNRARGNA